MQSEPSIQSGSSIGLFGLERPRWVGGLAQYRTMIYLATFLSGAVSLTFQVVWQRYLSFMVGSEARSISLVVAVFLLGLATGYRFWGNFTARGWDRRTMLKAVGYIELGIAGYGIIFPTLFLIVRDLAYTAPDALAVDFAATAALLFLPTFLMGASIPLLTAAVPATMQEVNYCHTRIYGINTLGAFLGTFIAGFLLVPTIGLSLSLIIGAIVNMVVGLIFVFNTLEGEVRKGEPVPPIPNRFGAKGIYLFVFITGAVTIGFEVLFMRVLALSIGAGHYIFPIVIGIVILGLAIGSLSIRRGSVTANRVIYELVKLGVLLSVVYFTVPYWPLWLSHMRVSLTSLPSNYGVFLTGVIVFMAILLLPVVIPMGRLLPMGYSLIDKNSSDYGKMCGRVYFSNTIGTVVGAVGLGYLLLILLDVDWIFKLNIAMILALAAYLVMRQGHAPASVACLFLAGLVLFLPAWDRQLHVQGVFRAGHVTHWHFKGPFTMPNIVDMNERVPYFNDDPSVTVAVTTVPSNIPGRPDSKTIFVNGKSDGNTVADYSNMALTAALPYLYANGGSSLDTAVIGLGMGITSGALAIFDDVEEVVTLEISSGVFDAVKTRGLFDEENFGLSQQERSTVIKTDAFRYFTRTNRSFDIIVSEPSNPWVVGVENLYTPEFYNMVIDRLEDDGIFFQWLQVYEINTAVLSAIVQNVALHFEHVKVYILGQYDLGIIASNAPFERPYLSQRLEERPMRRVLAPMAIDDADVLAALETYRTQQVRSLALNSVRPLHSMDRPWLGHAAGRARFLGDSVAFDSAHLAGTSRHLVEGPERREMLERLAEKYSNNLDAWCRPERHRHSTDFICNILVMLLEHREALRRPLTVQRINRVLAAYHHLREYGYIEADLALLDRIRGMLLESADQMPPHEVREALNSLMAEYSLERRWDRAMELVDEALHAGIIRSEEREGLTHRIGRLEFQFVWRMESLGEWRMINQPDEPAQARR